MCTNWSIWRAEFRKIVLGVSYPSGQDFVLLLGSGVLNTSNDSVSDRPPAFGTRVSFERNILGSDDSSPVCRWASFGEDGP